MPRTPELRHARLTAFDSDYTTCPWSRKSRIGRMIAATIAARAHDPVEHGDTIKRTTASPSR